MRRVDANIVLRYLLGDHPELSTRAAAVLEKESVVVSFEIICEVIYVLSGVYGVSRGLIAARLKDLVNFSNVETGDSEVLLCALQTFSIKKIDFVDALLYAYKTVRGDSVFTFDKQLSRLLASISDVS